jgi:uncharacterized protein
MDLEHLCLSEGDEAITADGTIIAFSEGLVFDASYHIACDASWCARSVQVTVSPSVSGVTSLRAGGKGHWWSEGGRLLPKLDGCIDVDFSATPFTNTLPIRRLHLQLEESAEIAVVYIEAP